MCGAHYELTWAICASKSLPRIRELRQWPLDSPPIRVINSGAVSALGHLDALELATSSCITAFAYELEAARNAATAHILTVIRPRLEVAFRNKKDLDRNCRKQCGDGEKEKRGCLPQQTLLCC